MWQIAKSLFCAKTRNAAIFLPHPRAAKCTAAAVKICHDAGVAAGAPEGFLECIEHPSMQVSDHVMKHQNVNIILATGGPGMVKASYSTGKPALGVGSGNAPILVGEFSLPLHSLYAWNSTMPPRRPACLLPRWGCRPVAGLYIHLRRRR